MEWISVKERLPDKNGQVIVWLGDDNFEHSTYKDGKFVTRYGNQPTYHSRNYRTREDLTADVIAWAELIHPNDLKYYELSI